MSSSTPSMGARPSPSSDSRRKRLSRSGQRRKGRFQTRRTRGGTAALHSDEVTTEGGSSSAVRHELGSREADEDVEEGTPRRCWPFFRVFVEKKYMRQFFRYDWGTFRLLFVISCVSRSVCAFVNLLSLIFSAPFVTCSEDEGKGDNKRCQKKFVWFVVIICVDFLISILYTIQFIARIEYAIYLRVQKDRVRGLHRRSSFV